MLGQKNDPAVTTFNQVKELSHKDMNYEANYVSSSSDSYTSSDNTGYGEEGDFGEEDEANMVDVLEANEVIKEEDEEASLELGQSKRDEEPPVNILKSS